MWYYRLPNSRVDLVSASLKLAGEQHIMIVVRAFPPRDSCRIRVSFESLYGMCVLFPSARAEMTFPSAESDLLMFFASSNTVPSAPVLLTWNNMDMLLILDSKSHLMEYHMHNHCTYTINICHTLIHKFFICTNIY